MSTTIRWGILGTGRIAGLFAEGLRAADGAVLHAVASRDEAKAQRFAARYGVRHAYGSYDAMLDDTVVDVIYVATPHVIHARNMLDCLAAGKAVLCEKPFTVNAGEAKEVAALAREKKLFVMEAMWTRFLPAIQAARQAILDGEIGTPFQAQGNFGFAANVGQDHRLFNPELGGGALLDLGVYPISIAALLCGPVASVQSLATLSSSGVDEQCSFVMNHANGVQSTLSCTLRAHSPRDFSVFGSEGYVKIAAPFHKSTELIIARGDRVRRLPLPYLGNGYTHEAVEVMECLRKGLAESPIMPLDETTCLLGVMDEIRSQIGVRYAADLNGGTATSRTT